MFLLRQLFSLLSVAEIMRIYPHTAAKVTDRLMQMRTVKITLAKDSRRLVLSGFTVTDSVPLIPAHALLDWHICLKFVAILQHLHHALKLY